MECSRDLIMAGQAEDCQGKISDHGHDLDPCPTDCLLVIFTEDHVTDPVIGLDRPVPAVEGQELRWRGLGRGQVGDPVDDLLGDSVAEEVKGLATDPVDLLGAGKRDAGGWDDPDLADDPLAADPLVGGVVGAAREGFRHQGHDGPQQVELVALDWQTVVPLAGDGQVGGGRVDRVCGVGGDHGVGQIDRVEQAGDLGDLGGVFGHGDLGDDDLLLVEECGEELDVDAGWARAVVDGLAVDGQAVEPSGAADGGWGAVVAFPVGDHACGDPGSDLHIGCGRVDGFRDAADGGAAGRHGAVGVGIDPGSGGLE